jgi:hypothetical protein
MKNIRLTRLFILLFVSFLCGAYARADETTVSFDSGSRMMFDQNNTALSGGTVLDGDGDVLQLGYFTGPNFSGTFVPLSGDGSANTAIVPESVPAEPYNKTSIGDRTAEGAGNGDFALSLDFVQGNATSGNSLPANHSQLAIRFYNGLSVTSSTAYNTVTDSRWTWQTPEAPPQDPVISISLDEQGLVWEGGLDSAFHTTIPLAVPEPSTWVAGAFVAATLAGAALRRIRA